LISISCKTSWFPTSATKQNIPVSDSINQLDSQLVQLYLPYKRILEKDMNRVISYSEKELVKNKPESELTNLLADLLLSAAIKEAEKNGIEVYPQISYFNYGGIRTSLPKGEITVGNIFELMPFENELVYVQINGVQLQHFFDLIAEKGGDSVGGVSFLISNQKAVNVFVKGEELNADSKYWIATNDYIANGGDGMEVFNQSIQLVNSNRKIRDIIIKSLEEKKKDGESLNAKLDGRIRNE
jgi:2',3'-cyclic-nucleotide 2'-phosphodiesterase (5'-nucleotidase family)